ncbi:3-oxoacyl-[acyl-carrier-protein] reductase [Clostridium algidicarnis]|uniref:3-oxoacyl-[acyl-carrier-protein] reductase n=2 Tax=Clostridium algidicarnis TaxID=37659 RepID=A0A2S6FXA3_9CLOT|nr:3-oxoacyl-[acyl-carrier-protein] reductase [Clostridium algidicarnis]MBB6630315.1 3-oxoacyl-[acyl-carrier-protein] reductase [Clostridium algidicarnis]MBU3203540.1 3-oxoacyl-[acyl-carrier-protein] reductase [Clostridium algidicarnis]MBU3211694.1 3-oxoacyl-[acyl-carrier-protein] reductase [Clostridium algidicarnis]MBU3218768.1 3-oxoacyl-[acyl-carrier-protein] reductase [Clostridium algidicarnis]MBU3221798.1 3-oxoacyl-[acyl-carrier-protein] reductase [Clostridium algidicarnis]
MLKRKTAIVTGASRGIGRAIALNLASQGVNIVLNYRNDVEAMQEVIKEIEAKGVRVVAIKGDVSDFKQAENIIKAATESFGSLDILVNNAGITRDGLIMRMKEEDFDNVIAVNLKGAFNCIRHASLVMMKQRSGKIINIASVVGIVGNAGQSNYAASKAGIIGITKSVARELACRGVNVNAVAPGFIETDMTAILSDKIKRVMEEGIPFKRQGKAEEVANVVSFLASDMASYITGQVINVDGGMVM